MILVGVSGAGARSLRPLAQSLGANMSVLNGVTAENSKRNYALALDELSIFCRERQQPVSRTLILEFRAAMLD